PAGRPAPAATTRAAGPGAGTVGAAGAFSGTTPAQTETATGLTALPDDGYGTGPAGPLLPGGWRDAPPGNEGGPPAEPER
ncbi:MAG TPA: hypothetical protein PLF91_16690, partial [Mycolicibacterium fallax]|nr:hypothetical protein [Mycolicibacterium fallax]